MKLKQSQKTIDIKIKKGILLFSHQMYSHVISIPQFGKTISLPPNV